MHKHTISFVNAIRGIWTATITQANIRIHLIAASLVLFLSVYLHISLDQIIDLILVISMVILAEMINTAIEFIADAITLEHNDYIKHAKDISAGAVLISVIFAIVVGVIIFLPKLI